jgi:large subunit ribosomal protein L28
MQRSDLTGKGKQFGHHVPFSQKKTNKVWKPNLQTKRLVIDGKKVKMKLSTQDIRTLKKQGVLTNTTPQKSE